MRRPIAEALCLAITLGVALAAMSACTSPNAGNGSGQIGLADTGVAAKEVVRGSAGDSASGPVASPKSTAKKPSAKTRAKKKATTASTRVVTSKKAAAASPVAREVSTVAARRYARRAVREQMDSRVNLSKLAAGKITSFSIDSQSRSGSTWRARITATFSDGSSAPGDLVFSKYEGSWYFSSMTGRRTTQTGEAGSVSTGSAPTDGPVDESIVAIIMSQTKTSQPVYRSLVNGQITGVTVNGVDRGLGTGSLNVTLRMSSGSSRKGRVGMIRKGQFWYLVRFTYV